MLENWWRMALSAASTTPDQLTAVAVGNRPGLIGSLLVGVSAGLAMMGFQPFAVTFARFASKRAAATAAFEYVKEQLSALEAA